MEKHKNCSFIGHRNIVVTKELKEKYKEIKRIVYTTKSESIQRKILANISLKVERHLLTLMQNKRKRIL